MPGAASAGLLLAGDRLLLTLAGTGVRPGALTTHGQPHAVTTALVGADLDLAPDVGGDGAAQVALGLVVRFDVIAKRNELLVGQLVASVVATDANEGKGLGGAGAHDAEDVGECDLQALLARQKHTNEACHEAFPFRCRSGCRAVPRRCLA